MESRSLFLGLAAGAALTGSLSTAQAALLGYDDLNAPAGQLIVNTGAGWNEPWNPQSPTAGYVVADSNPLTFAKNSAVLQTTGNYAVGGGGWTSAGRQLALGAPWSPASVFQSYTKTYTDPNQVQWQVIGNEGTTFWASMLVRDDVANNRDYTVSLHNVRNVSWNPGGTSRTSIGIDSTNHWKLDLNSGAQVVSTDVVYQPGQTYLMVMKFDFAETGDTVSLFVDPTPGLAAPDTTAFSLAAAADVNFNNLYFYPSSDANRGSLDEIRFGESFQDVTPLVPEPASLGLLAAGGLLALRRRR